MKNSIFIIMLTLICQSINSQTLSNVDYSHVPNNAYVQDVQGKLNVFLGNWRWTDGNNTELIVKFVKKTMFGPEGGLPYTIDVILGGYKYTSNGIVIVDTTNFTTTLDFNDDTTLENYAKIITQLSEDHLSLTMNFADAVLEKTGKGSFNLVDPLTLSNGNFTTQTAHWKIREGGYNPGSPAGFAIPTDVIMTKMP